MNIVDTLRRIANKMERKKTPLFLRDVSKQRTFLESIREPSDDIERSYAQYRCQIWLQGRISSWFINLAALPLLAAILLQPAKKETGGSLKPTSATGGILAGSQSLLDRVPDELWATYGDIKADDTQGQQLTDQDKMYLRNVLKRHPCSWLFALKCAIKIRQYRQIIDTWAPKAIIACSEYSFTSSLLTDYLKKNGIKHINVMHGNKLFYIRDSFFRFDECYAWNNDFVNLFLKLRAEPSQFRVSIPKGMKFMQDAKIEQTADITYYLGGEERVQIERLSTYLGELSTQGAKVRIRPHPRYTDQNLLSLFDANITIENPRDIPLEDSVLSTRYASSLYSTVLIQADLNGIPVIVDDLSDPCRYEKLKQLEFFLLERNHMLLSDFVNKWTPLLEEVD